jgi:uncharacterized protein YggE
MNRRTMVILGIVAAAALVIGFAASAMGSDQASSTAKPSRTITVTSTATVKAKPDEALVNFGVRSEDADSAVAMAQNAKDMQAVLDALKAAGIADKDIQTLDVALDQRVENRGRPSERTVFVASNSVQVTIHALASIGHVIDAAVGAGADSVNDVRFLLSDPNTIRTDALSQAVKGARTKADALAQAAGAKVLGVVTINEEAYRAPVYHAPFQQKLAFGAVAAAPTPVVAPNSLEVSVTVTVVWEID